MAKIKILKEVKPKIKEIKGEEQERDESQLENSVESEFQESSSGGARVAPVLTNNQGTQEVQDIPIARRATNNDNAETQRNVSYQVERAIGQQRRTYTANEPTVAIRNNTQSRQTIGPALGDPSQNNIMRPQDQFSEAQEREYQEKQGQSKRRRYPWEV